ncbi:hypothetical protein [Crocinitomix catalasitica]|uniref:hypothetical protein n=1 Tax=Crocinitomix catalasitica TaxID=184607 RepID=UPI0004865DFD|nr:hypothetical protein [Crocinitomix catalasitica]
MDLNIGEEYFIYENKQLNCLIAILKTDQKIIKTYWKKYKGKSVLGIETIKGYLLIQDEEQDSLKINFSESNKYQIKNLIKFD